MLPARKAKPVPKTVAQEYSRADKGKKLAEAMKRMPEDG